MRQNLYLLVLLLLVSGCISVRVISEENDSKLPEVNSLPDETEVSPSISLSPMLISTESKTINGSPTISTSPMMISTTWKEIQIPQPIITPGIWYFLAVTRQDRTITLYLNGRAVSFGDFDRLNLDAPISLKFGRQDGFPNMYFDGRIDEVEIYNGTALTPQQIYMLYSAGSYGKCKGSGTSTCAPPPAGLTGWWPADGNTEDINSSLNGEFLRDATTRPGKVGEAFAFDGEGDYIEVSDNPALNFGIGDFTIDLWVTFNDLADNQGLVTKWFQEESQNQLVSYGWTLAWVDHQIRFLWGDGITQGILGIYIRQYSTATPTITPIASP